MAADNRSVDKGVLALLGHGYGAAQAARAGGFPDRAAFERACLRVHGLSPAALEDLPQTLRYRFTYGGAFHLARTLQYLGRDPQGLAVRLDGNRFRRHFPVGNRNLEVELTLQAKACEVSLPRPPSPHDFLRLHKLLRRFLGLEQPLRD